MAESVHIVSRVMRTIVLLHDDAAMTIERKKLDGVRARYDAALEAMNKTTASEKGVAIRAKIAETQRAARALNN